MIKYKYGKLPKEQVVKYKKKLHSLVHWLLIYQEENQKILDNYFEMVQLKLDGFNEIMQYPTEMIEIINLVESAHIEFHKTNFNHKIYRRLILDIHSLIDKMFED